MVEPSAHELSGGELMRFCIARALLAHPRYLICDEMSAMLDAVTQAEVWRALLALAEERGMGIVMVSHAPALLDRIATRRVSVGAGRRRPRCALEPCRLTCALRKSFTTSRFLKFVLASAPVIRNILFAQRRYTTWPVRLAV